MELETFKSMSMLTATDDGSATPVGVITTFPSMLAVVVITAEVMDDEEPPIEPHGDGAMRMPSTSIGSTPRAPPPRANGESGATPTLPSAGCAMA
jgi:hypothetical protein